MFRNKSSYENRKTLIGYALSSKDFTARQVQQWLTDQQQSLNLGTGETVKEFLDRQVFAGYLNYDPVNKIYNPFE